MKLLDSILLHLCFFPSYLWYARRIEMGGEETLSVCLVSVCLVLAYAQKKWSEEAHSNRQNNVVLCGVVFYIILWMMGVPAILKASLAITILLYYYKLLPHFGISALAYLSLPWLSSFQYFFGYPLRRLVAEGGALLLNGFDLSVEAQGTGLLFDGSQVLVDPPCSGVRMIWAILVLTAFLAVVFRSSWRKGIALGVIALVIAVLGNIIRAVILFFPESQLVHWPHWTHEAVGLASYALVCVALIGIFNFINHDKKTTSIIRC